jgi:hypothetical protein
MSKGAKIFTSIFLVVEIALTMILLVLAPASATALLFIWVGCLFFGWVMYLLVEWMMTL